MQVDGGTTATYVYNALDQRVRVTTGSSDLEFLYDPFGRRQSTWLVSNNSGIEGRVYWDYGLLAHRAQNGGTYFHQPNYLGTERVRTDWNAHTTSSYVSGPFGEGGSAGTGSDTNQDSNGFTGQDHDPESGTDHFQFRQYSEVSGRWLSPDPYYGSYDRSNPQSFNRFAYVLNNPLGFVDPDGYEDPDGTSDDSQQYSQQYLSSSNSPSGTYSQAPDGTVIYHTPPVYACSIQCQMNFSNFTPPSPGPGSVSISAYGSGGAGLAPTNPPASGLVNNPAFQRRAEAAARYLCKANASAQIVGSIRGGAIIGALRGGLKGFVAGEVLGGEVTFGVSGIPAAIGGAVIEGTIGGAGGLVKGVANAAACQANGAYDGKGEVTAHDLFNAVF